MTDVPIKVIGFNDGRMALKNNSKLYCIVKGLFTFFLVFLIIESIFWGEFLLVKESLSVWICVAITLAYLVKNGGHERKECYSELQFYKEFMIFYVPKHFIKYNDEKMEYQKIYYKDVIESVYRVNTRKIVIKGQLEEKHYKYITPNLVEENPCYSKKYNGMIKFYTIFDHEHDFKKIIETYTPLKIEERNE